MENITNAESRQLIRELLNYLLEGTEDYNREQIIFTCLDTLNQIIWIFARQTNTTVEALVAELLNELKENKLFNPVRTNDGRRGRGANSKKKIK